MDALLLVTDTVTRDRQGLPSLTIIDKEHFNKYKDRYRLFEDDVESAETLSEGLLPRGMDLALTDFISKHDVFQEFVNLSQQLNLPLWLDSTSPSSIFHFTVRWPYEELESNRQLSIALEVSYLPIHTSLDSLPYSYRAYQSTTPGESD